MRHNFLYSLLTDTMALKMTTTHHQKLLVVSSFLLVLWLAPSGVGASWGDQHQIFRNFRRHCLNTNCSSEIKTRAFKARQPLYLQFLGWVCWSECTYESMWYLTKKTMDEFNRVPQFYGKVNLLFISLIYFYKVKSGITRRPMASVAPTLGIGAHSKVSVDLPIEVHFAK